MEPRQRAISSIIHEKNKLIEALYTAVRDGHLKQIHILHKRLDKTLIDYDNRLAVIESKKPKRKRTCKKQ